MSKQSIHPTYYPEAPVTCSCGEKYTIGSTKESLRVDICRACHPFYSGNQKLIDTAGRVDRFREKMAQAKARQPKAVAQPVVAEPEAVVEVAPEVESVEEQPTELEAEPTEAPEAEAVADESTPEESADTGKEDQ
jgi:large subunit ribosomal protein L31